MSMQGVGQWEDEATSGCRVSLAVVRPQLCSYFHGPKLTCRSGRWQDWHLHPGNLSPRTPKGAIACLLEAHSPGTCKTQSPKHSQCSMRDSNLNKQSMFFLVGGAGREK